MDLTIRTSECAWANVELAILGRKIKGLRGFSFKRGKEKEHLYGAGSHPLDIQDGNIKPEGNIKVLGFEFDELTRIAQRAGYLSLDDVPHEYIVLTAKFQKRKTDPVKIITATGCGFYDTEQAMEQNAKYMEVTLNFLAIRVDTVII